MAYLCNSRAKASGKGNQGNDCKLLAHVSPNDSAPVTGEVTGNVWVANVQPTEFVKRHYHITPADNVSTASAKVKLFFTQQEFNVFNAVNSTKLPYNAADAENYKANLRIEKRSGVSSGEFGQRDHLIPCQMDHQSSLSFISYPVINQLLKVVISG